MKILFSLIGWVLSALSLIGLIEDLAWVDLHGKFAKWVDAYTGFTHRVSNLLFGWIDIGWLSISEKESHILVVSLIISIALYRASVAHGKQTGDSAPRTVGIANFVLAFSCCFVPAVILPGMSGTAGAVAGLTFWIMIAYVREFKSEGNEPSPFPPVAATRRELGGVVIVFLAMVLLNHLYFK